MKTTKHYLAPSECKNDKQACSLNRSIKERGDFTILTDGYRVTITQQKMGEAPTRSITLSPKVFNELVKWWNRKQVILW